MDNINKLKTLLDKFNNISADVKSSVLNDSHLTDYDFGELVNSLDNMIDLDSTTNIYYHEDDLRDYGYISEIDIPDIMTDDLEMVDRWLSKRSECRIDLDVLLALYKGEELSNDDKDLVKALLDDAGLVYERN